MTSELKPKGAMLEAMEANAKEPSIVRDALEARAQRMNTRAVPDVPELVRYDLNNPDTYRRVMSKAPNGAYVRYDQAAEIIAANRAEKHKAQNAVLNLERKLAQIKAQEPVGSVAELGIAGSRIKVAHNLNKDLEVGTPLYAAPVDQKAEIERLREALNYYANVSPISYDIGHTARAALSGKEPK